MTINRGYCYELDLNNVQRTRCLQHAGCARFAFNWGLAQKIAAYKAGEKTPTAIDLHKRLNAVKSEQFPWLYESSKCAPQESLRDLDRAFDNFFAKRSKFPRFKSKHRGIGGFRLTGSIRIQDKYVTLPRLGNLKLKEKSSVRGRILSASVRERSGHWFVSIQVEQQIVVPENQGPAVGIDLGLNRLATLCDGTGFENPRPLKKALGLIRRVSRTLARRCRGSSRYKLAKRRLACLHYRVSCIRSDVLHKLTTTLTEGCGVIGIEDLNVAGMMRNHCLARSLGDAAFGEFRRQVEYKSLWRGCELVVHHRFFASSKTCSRCGTVKETLPLSERVFRCESCGLELDRDHNAAINLRPAVRRLQGVEEGSAGREDITLGETASCETSTKLRVLHG